MAHAFLFAALATVSSAPLLPPVSPAMMVSWLHLATKPVTLIAASWTVSAVIAQPHAEPASQDSACLLLALFASLTVDLDFTLIQPAIHVYHVHPSTV